MGAFAAGAVVLVPFPFSDLSQAKLRPAVVLAAAGKDDWILCQITSNPYADAWAIKLTGADFLSGSLSITSYGRPGKLFTAHQSLVRAMVGILHPAKPAYFVEKVAAMIQGGLGKSPSP